MHEHSNQLHLACRDEHHARPAWWGKRRKQRGGGSTWRSLGRQWQPAMAVVPGGGAGGSRWLAMLFFFSLSPLFFVHFSASFFFFRPSPSLFSSLLALSLLFFLLFLVLPSCSAPPVFIGKNRGGTCLGQPLCCGPSNTWKVWSYVGVFLMLFRRRKSGKTGGRKSTSSPASRV